MTEPHYIKADYLIDGSGEPVKKHILLTIKNSIIHAIEDYNKCDAPPASALTDLSQCTILPPFIDSHVHLCMSGSTDKLVRKHQLTASYEETCPRITEHVHYHFSHGILAVRDGGDKHGYVQRYKSDLSDRKQAPVTIQTPGHAWHNQDRYGSFIGQTPLYNQSLAAAGETVLDRVDHIKLINSGVNSFETFGRESSPQFDLDEIKKLARAAEKQDRKIMVHANGSLPVSLAIKAGCHSIEHGFFMGSDNVKRLADAKITWVPTAVTMKAYDVLPDGESKCRGKVAQQTLQHQLKQMALARRYGVTIALGTDSGCKGVLHGKSAAEELKLILKAGYSLPEAVRCATYNGAQLLGLKDLGLLAKGQPATFIVARATPAMLPRKLSYLEAIYIDGTPCDTNFFHKF